MQLAAIYLASGFGRRFGSNKLLHPVGGRPLYQHGFKHLQQALIELDHSGLWECRLIVVSAYPEILAWCRQQGALVRQNEMAAEGIAASIRLGIQQAGTADAYAFFVADQPWLQPSTIRRFLTGFVSSGQAMGCLQAPGYRGNPAVFAGQFRDTLLQLRGDRGGNALLRQHPEQVWLCEAPLQELQDVDTLSDLAKRQ